MVVHTFGVEVQLKSQSQDLKVESRRALMECERAFRENARGLGFEFLGLRFEGLGGVGFRFMVWDLVFEGGYVGYFRGWKEGLPKAPM